MAKRSNRRHERLDTDEPWLGLWGIKCRLAGLGLLLKGAGEGDPDLGHEEAFLGLGDMIEELAGQVGDIHDAIENQRSKRGNRQ